MILKTLTLKNYRCYDTFSLEAHPNLNIIVGDNAQGKTSILEAIHVLGLTKSHKTMRDDKLIRTDQDFAKIEGTFDKLKSKTSLSVVISKTGKKVKYNRIEVSKLSDYIGYLNVVMFAPEDLELIKGSPGERRRFLDIELGQLSKGYMQHLLHYRRILKERNEVLKSLNTSNKFNLTMLDVLTDQLIHYAEKIIRARENFVQTLNDLMRSIIPKISDEDPSFTIKYYPSVNNDFKAQFKAKQSLELALKSTQIGPHRDDVGFLYENQPIKDTASQGQIRTVALALKLAVMEIIKKTKDAPPIILLDDVFSELDKKRQVRLIKLLSSDTQVFITTTEIKHIDLTVIKDYSLFTIASGTLKGDERHG